MREEKVKDIKLDLSESCSFRVVILRSRHDEGAMLQLARRSPSFQPTVLSIVPRVVLGLLSLKFLSFVPASFSFALVENSLVRFRVVFPRFSRKFSRLFNAIHQSKSLF